MDYPRDAKGDGSKNHHLGHEEEGRTIALHSLGVLPTYQGRGLGRTILKSYIQRMSAAGIADHISLLCKDELIGFYETAGFENKGQSKAQFGGGGWNDMTQELVEPRPGMM